MFSAIDIAKYILTYANQHHYAITNLRLQKLLYLVYKEYLQQYNQQLFQDKIYAWEFGPSVKTVYKEFEHGSIFIQNTFNNLQNFDNELIQLMNNIMEKYSEYPIDRLIYLLTSSKTAWAKVYNPSKEIEITSDLIKKEL